MRITTESFGKHYLDALKLYKKKIANRATRKSAQTSQPPAVVKLISILDLSKTAERVVQSIAINTPEGTSHNREIVSEGSTTFVRDNLTNICQNTSIFEFEWLIPKVYTIISHGHGFEFLLGGEKIADLHVTANAAVKMRISSETRETVIPGGKSINTDRFNRLIVECQSHNPKVSTEINTKTFKYTYRNLHGGDEVWENYKSEVNLNYLLKTSKDSVGSKYLVIGFSAIRPLGDFTYNYKSSIESIDVNTLFILDDFGDQGAYYYSDHGDLGIFNSVQNLLKHLCEELSIPASNMILIGSSKGGAAAIIHGVKANAGHVYVGAPQTLIGTFVAIPHPNILELTTGETTPAAIDRLDQVIFDLVSTAETFPKTTIIVGNADHHYEKHALPLKEFAEDRGNVVNLQVLNGVPHAEIGYKYRELLHGYISRVLANESRLMHPGD